MLRVLVALMLAVPLLAPVAAPQTASGTIELMVLGETHGTQANTRALVDLAVSKGATGCVCPGDFIYGDWSATPSGWRGMMQPLMGTMLPARGNHDHPWSDWSMMFPDGRSYYAKDVGALQVIALDTEQSLAPGSAQRTWLEGTLAARDASALKLVEMHRPWWLPDGARHPTSEFEWTNGASAASMDALMVKHGVDLVVSAHEKNHQHSLRDGVHYLVAGGGGPGDYALSYALPGAVKRTIADTVSTLEIGASGMTLKSYDINGNKVDEFAMGASAPAPAPAPSPSPAPSVAFTPKGGNEWWVQVRVDGAGIGAVEARDANTPWTVLTKRSWGDHAGSFRVEPGNLVTYRATLTDGRIVESCPATHPGGVFQCAGPAPAPAPAPSAFDATFANARGNAWWVEVDVRAAGGTLAGVEARVNGGAWQPLGKQSWGSWAKGVSAPAGSTVEFRARSTDGATDASTAYRWPPG